MILTYMNGAEDSYKTGYLTQTMHIVHCTRSSMTILIFKNVTS